MRQLRPNSRVAYAIAGVVAGLAAMIALACAYGHALGAARALLAQLSVLVGVAQGATLVAALMALAPSSPSSPSSSSSSPRAGVLRRTAELVALAMPAAALAQLVMAALTTVLARHGASASAAAGALGTDLARTGAGCLLALLGTAFLAAALGPELLAAYERGEIDHPALRALWRANARLRGTPLLGPRGARAFALAYVLAYAAGAPWTAHALVAAVRPAGPMLGPYLAASDAVCGLGVVLVVAAVRALGTDEPDESDAELAHAAVVLALASVALGGLTLLPFVAALGAGGAGGAGLFAAVFPVFAPTHAWQGLAFCGLVVGCVAPATVLGSRVARKSVATVGLFAALAVLGVWLVRVAVVVPASAPRYGLIDLGAGLFAATLGVLCVAALMRSVVLEVLLEARPRPSLFPRISQATV